MNNAVLIPILIEAASFVSAFAAIAAAIILARFIKKSVAGGVAAGFKTIAIGIFILALGITVDAINTYLQLQSPGASNILLIIRQVFFIIGAYIILIGSKNMDIWKQNEPSA